VAKRQRNGTQQHRNAFLISVGEFRFLTSL
jgi:hypothetical protein